MDNTIEKIKEAHEQRNLLAKPKDAISTLQKLAREIKDDPLLSYDYPLVLKKLAICYSDIGEIDKAYESFKEALEKAQEDLNEIEKADIRGQIASLELKTATPEKALEYALKSWKYIGKKRGERFTETKVNTSLVLGNIYFEQALYKKAVKFYRNALNHARNINYKEGIFAATIGVAKYYMVQEKVEKAKETIEEEIEKAQEYKVMHARMQMQLSKIYLEEGDKKTSKTLALEAHKIFKKGKFLRLQAQCSQLLGTLFAFRNQKKADSFFKIAFDIYNDYGFNIPKEHPKQTDWYTDFDDL